MRSLSSLPFTVCKIQKAKLAPLRAQLINSQLRSSREIIYTIPRACLERHKSHENLAVHDPRF